MGRSTDSVFPVPVLPTTSQCIWRWSLVR